MTSRGQERSSNCQGHGGRGPERSHPACFPHPAGRQEPIDRSGAYPSQSHPGLSLQAGGRLLVGGPGLDWGGGSCFLRPMLHFREQKFLCSHRWSLWWDYSRGDQRDAPEKGNVCAPPFLGVNLKLPYKAARCVGLAPHNPGCFRGGWRWAKPDQGLFSSSGGADIPGSSTRQVQKLTAD